MGLPSAGSFAWSITWSLCLACWMVCCVLGAAPWCPACRGSAASQAGDVRRLHTTSRSLLSACSCSQIYQGLLVIELLPAQRLAEAKPFPGHAWCMQGVISCVSAGREGLLPCNLGWLKSQAVLLAHFCQQLLKLLLLLLLQSHDLLLPSVHGCRQVFNILPASTRLFQSRHHKVHHGPDGLASSLQLALELLPILQLLCHLHLQGAGIPTQGIALAAGEADVPLQLQIYGPT